MTLGIMTLGATTLRPKFSVLAGSFFETSPYERAESPLSNDTKLANIHMGK